ncbi:hypothetical protein [Arthrobacter sp. A5]|uniref:hypothetical protein n=1 Tax=Arthrobacter sp. A5 TaxID=576926 RepID=UPI003DA90454
MDSFEVSVDHELFRISERYEPNGTVNYNFAWLNGPADGNYGFTIGFPTADPASAQSGSSSKMSREQLVVQTQGFLDSFYGIGGIGEEDFPDHVPARMRGTSKS